MKKRALSICLVLALSLSMFLAGCGNDEKPSASPSGSTPVTEPSSPGASQPAGDGDAASDWEPNAPINIINYVAAGGGMDVATREFAQIASKYTDATFVVDNRTGAGGLIAMDYVLDQPADGYTIFAGTISNISAIISGEEDTEHYIWGFEWIDNIMQDPMSILVRDNDNTTLDELIADAKAQGGSQIWVGPSTGGIKNIIALKFWDALGIEATWVPFESGPLAMTALLGGQGVASVGNPSDVNGRELKNLVIATDEKLSIFPDTPNFAELGFPELDSVSMWRGFAVKKGTPPEMIKWFQDLCQKVTEDPDWIAFFDAKAITVKNDTTETFEAQIKADIEDHLVYLKKFGLISDDYTG